jgi:ABC-type branched-subunit amino acid transport system substrate-binding protein
VVDAPQVTGGVKAAFRYLNSHGGLGKLHQKVNVRVCNTQFSPPGEIQCAAQAAGDKNAIAMVAPLIILGTAQFTSTLQKAGLPAVNPAASDDSVVKNPINFPLGGSTWTRPVVRR